MKTENDRIQLGGDGLAVDTVVAWESDGKSAGSRQTVVDEISQRRIISLAQMLLDAGITTTDEVAAARETAW